MTTGQMEQIDINYHLHQSRTPFSLFDECFLVFSTTHQFTQHQLNIIIIVQKLSKYNQGNHYFIVKIELETYMISYYSFTLYLQCI